MSLRPSYLVLPNGYGKSLIYQLLPKVFSQFYFEKTGVSKVSMVTVVSPLELIRKQQVERLKLNGIKATSLEDLSLKGANVEEGTEIVFGSTEHWLSDKWRKHFKDGVFKEVEFLVVDEVHTIETW